MITEEIQEQKTMIREISSDELNRLIPLAYEFYSLSIFLQGFNSDIFKKNWKLLINSGVGTIFISDNKGLITGAIGGVIYPDINSGELMATEFFWFVREQFRGIGIKLMHSFINWAKEKGCKKIVMVHLYDVMSDKLDSVYKRLGFKACEIHYIKEV